MQTAPQSGFLQWWGGQLRDLGLMVSAKGGARLVLAVDGLEARWLVDSEHGIAAFGDGTAFPLSQIETHTVAARASGLAVGLRVPVTDCLVRNIELPTAAVARFEEILRLDLERATPFRAADVLTTYDLPGGLSRGATTRVRQLVLKRERVAPWLARLEALGLAPVTLDCFDETGAAALPVNFLQVQGIEPPAAGGAVRAALALLCLALAGGAAWTWHSRQSQALAAVQQATSAAREKAVAAQRQLDGATGTLDNLAALRRVTTGPLSATELIEILTRLLPDTAYLHDLRIEGDVIEMAGLAQGAAGLLTLFERSGRFTGSELTAPVILDPTGRERFTIRTRVKTVDAATPASARP